MFPRCSTVVLYPWQRDCPKAWYFHLCAWLGGMIFLGFPSSVLDAVLLAPVQNVLGQFSVFPVILICDETSADSSENFFRWLLAELYVKSAVYRVKRKEARTVPCGTPVLQSVVLDWQSCNLKPVGIGEEVCNPSREVVVGLRVLQLVPRKFDLFFILFI